MTRDTKNLTIVMSILIVAIVGLTIAYAALSANLTVTFNSVTQNAATWNVAFSGGPTVTGTPAGTSTSDIKCGAATISGTTVSVADTTLTKPDDTCTYSLTVKNSGSISAKLSTITIKNASGTSVSCSQTTTNTAKLTCGNITYQLLKDTQDLTPQVGGTIAPSNNLNLNLVVKHTGQAVAGASAITQTGAAFTLVFAQA